MALKKPAEKEIKVLIAKMRLTCETLADCPIKPAREPSQLDCIACILEDVGIMVKELSSLREFKAQVTQYGTTVTKFEAALNPDVLPLLRSQIKEV